MPRCMAVVDDRDRPAYHAPQQGLSAPGDKPCPRRASDRVGHLHLCATHARLAREGLVSEQGRVAHREDRRAVHRYPDKFPHGLHLWAQEERMERTPQLALTPAPGSEPPSGVFVIETPQGLVAGYNWEHSIVSVAASPDDVRCFMTRRAAERFLDRYADCGYGLARATATIKEVP